MKQVCSCEQSQALLEIKNMVKYDLMNRGHVTIRIADAVKKYEDEYEVTDVS